MKVQYTRRKFYGKWLYKVSFRVPGVSILRVKPIETVIPFLELSNDPSLLPNSIKFKAHQSKDTIKRIVEFLITLNIDSWTKRIENDILDIYTNDEGIFNNATSVLKDIVHNASAPDPNNISILDNSSNVIVKKYPHNKYKHKVYLLPHRMSKDESVRVKYLDWVESQPNILISSAVKDWFVRTFWNWDRRYVLVEDSQTLLMLKLRNPDVIGKVYDYVLTDK